MVTMSRTALAMASMLVCLGSVQAEKLSYSELESRLTEIESQLATQTGLQQAAYCDGGCVSSCSDSCCCDSGGCCGTGCCGDGCCDSCYGGCDCCSACGGSAGGYFQMDMMFLRAHVKELPPAFKLAEEYEFSPRFILGFENRHGVGARVRYWHYGHNLDNLSVPGLGVRYEWDVFDLEATTRMQFRRTDVTLGAGVRYAETDITSGNVTDDANLIGGTIAADVETLIGCSSNNYCSLVYGGRSSILGGDWNRQGVSLNRDDNVVAHEVYGGFEYGCSVDGFDLYSQLKFEIQNWHSDFLAGVNGGNGYSVSFLGPSIALGVGY